MQKVKSFQKIVDTLALLKDTSELMLDLAYSSLLLNSTELAKEVLELEDYMDNLHTEFELSVLSSGFKPKESKDFLGLIRLGVVTEKIADAAAEMADVVLRGVEPHRVLTLVIKEAEETVTRLQVSENSPLIGKTLREARIPGKTGMWILVIRRGGKWIRPKPEVMLEVGDVLLASGYTDGEEDLKKLVLGKSPEQQ